LDLCTVRLTVISPSLSFLTDSSLSFFSAPLSPHLPPTAALPLASLSGCWAVLWDRDLYGSPQNAQLNPPNSLSTPLLTLSLSLQQLSTHHSPGLSCSVCPKATVCSLPATIGALLSLGTIPAEHFVIERCSEEHRPNRTPIHFPSLHMRPIPRASATSF
jgi:hypothetical protein